MFLNLAKKQKDLKKFVCVKNKTQKWSEMRSVTVILHVHLFREIASMCDRNIFMMMNLGSMSKLLKCAGNDDIITIKADGGSDIVTFMFESSCKFSIYLC